MHWYTCIDLRIGIRLGNGRARVRIAKGQKDALLKRAVRAAVAEDVSLTKIRSSLCPPPAPASITLSVNESRGGGGGGGTLSFENKSITCNLT